MIETKEKILLGMLDLVAETGLEKASIGRLDDEKIDILNDLIWSGLYVENRVMS